LTAAASESSESCLIWGLARAKMCGFFPNAAELFAETGQFQPYSARNQGRDASAP
jgi:hypothetical protein